VSEAKQAALVLLGAALVLESGCETASPYQELRSDLRDKNAEVLRLRKENRRMADELDQVRAQLAALNKLGDKRLEMIPHAVKLNISRYTRLVRTRRHAGGYLVKVYLEPIDQHGSPFKAAGDVNIQVYDLAAEPDKNLLGEFTWSAEQIPEHWAGRLLTNHFSFTCPLEEAPVGEEITVRAKFVDYLTGRALTAQKVCKVDEATEPVRESPDRIR